MRSPGRRTTGNASALLLGPVLLLVGCTAGTEAGFDAEGGVGGESTSAAEATHTAAITVPPAGADFDYQLGGAYDPPAGTEVVVRDATDEPAVGVYSICYVNGFQTQPGEADDWDGLILEDDGEPVTDPDWPDEYVLDTSSAASREAIAAQLEPVIAGCAAHGFQAVEFDNLDSFERSAGALTLEDNLTLAEILTASAHDHGLASAQKNTVEATQHGPEGGFDLAITEDCGAWDECAAYQDVYDVVLDVEYADADEFAAMCTAGTVPATAIRRDLDLVAAGQDGYVLERCEGS
jgi:hypothetical protein